MSKTMGWLTHKTRADEIEVNMLKLTKIEVERWNMEGASDLLNTFGLWLFG